MKNEIDVMVVDDSAVVRQVLKEILDAVDEVGKVTTARDPVRALELMEKSWPDVIVLDLEMPRMDGLTFLRKLMHEHPTPVIICSAITADRSSAALTALRHGAVEVIAKPQAGVKGFLTGSAGRFIDSVRAAAQANLRAIPAARNMSAPKRRRPAKPRATAGRRAHGYRLIAVGSSTGGPNALETVVERLTPTSPPVVVVQHMPEKFTAVLAQLLDQKSGALVKEAQHDDLIVPGTVHIAPGGRHMSITQTVGALRVALHDAPPVRRHRPSVDVLFRSISSFAGGEVLALILTGMGDDGAAGLLKLRAAGAVTMAQEESSCVVYGMPKAAVANGAADGGTSLQDMVDAMLYNSRRAA